MNAARIPREPELLGQAVVVIGGSGGIGLETAHETALRGPEVILTGRINERLQRAASELDALNTARRSTPPTLLSSSSSFVTCPLKEAEHSANEKVTFRDIAHVRVLFWQPLSLYQKRDS